MKMKKLSVLALVLALTLAVTACASPSGLLLREATVKQMDLESYESMTTFSFDVNSLLMKNSFSFDVYAKQVDLLNTLTEIYVGQDLLALAGFELKPATNGKVALELIMKDGEMIVSSSEDHVGIQLMNMLEMPGAELNSLPFESKEELEEWILTLQDKFREIFKAYLADYDFSLEQIHDQGQKMIDLPNGDNVNTQHIQVELSALDLVNMLHYSLNHFVDDEEFQEAFYTMLVDMTLLEEGKTASDIPASELANMREAMQTEINPAVKEMAAELETLISEELSEQEQALVDSASFVVDTYIGVDDKEIYQMDYRLDLMYSEELSELDMEEMQDIPLLPGDSFSFVMSQQIWNHNKALDPISVPSQLIPMEKIMEMKNVDEFKEVAGENSLLAQIAEHAMSFMGGSAGDFGFVELKVDENKIETIDGEEAVQIYLKDGQLMAPLALVSEAMGAGVMWIPDTHYIIVATDEHYLRVETANNYTVSLNGEIRSDIMVEIIDGTSYVNVRAYAEALGWTVIWMEETNSALILQ